MSSVLSVEGLAGGYPGEGRVVENISFSVEAEEVLGIVGANGSGKTTLLRCIFGLVEPASGTIALGDDKNAPPSIYRSRVAGMAYLPQERQVFPSMTVRENLRLACELGGNKTSERLPAIVDRMAGNQSWLKRRLDSPTKRLSGGQQKIVGLLALLIRDPQVALIDEPSTALSAELEELFFEQIRSMAKRNGAGVVIVEQKLDRVAQYCDRFIRVKAGRVAERGVASGSRMIQGFE